MSIFTCQRMHFSQLTCWTLCRFNGCSCYWLSLCWLNATLVLMLNELKLVHSNVCVLYMAPSHQNYLCLKRECKIRFSCGILDLKPCSGDHPLDPQFECGLFLGAIWALASKCQSKTTGLACAHCCGSPGRLANAPHGYHPETGMEESRSPCQYYVPGCIRSYPNFKPEGETFSGMFF